VTTRTAAPYSDGVASLHAQAMPQKDNLCGAFWGALDRGDGHEGGVLCVLPGEAAAELRRERSAEGFDLRDWDNGTPDHGRGG
jgi:hypothetical protein